MFVWLLGGLPREVLSSARKPQKICSSPRQHSMAAAATKTSFKIYLLKYIFFFVFSLHLSENTVFMITLHDSRSIIKWLEILDKNEIGAVFARTIGRDFHSSPFSMTAWSQNVLEASTFTLSTMTLTTTSEVTSLSFVVTLNTHCIT